MAVPTRIKAGIVKRGSTIDMLVSKLFSHLKKGQKSNVPYEVHASSSPCVAYPKKLAI